MKENYKDVYSREIERILVHIPRLEKIKNSNILVSGCTGMLCSVVVDILLYLNLTRNYSIKVFLAARNKSRVAERFAFWGMEYDFIEYDATKYETIEVNAKLNYIIHGASNASPKVYVNEPVETMLANSLGTKVLLDLALDNAARFLYVSSSEVYGKKDTSNPYKETDYGYIDILNPRSCYPTSKRFAETLCASYSVENNVDTVIVRPGHIYGHTITATDDRASAQFTRSAVHGEDIIMKSKGLQLRSYCHVLDCASALLCVLINGERNTAYNISNPNSVVTISQMAEALSKAGDVKILFDTPSEQESKGFNLMDNSALDSSRITELGWRGEYTMQGGADITIALLSAWDGADS
ncbi:Nucleoside-diphosphate-sugar epimerase [Ruminococcaceae bacterium KH2T8]|nr:Nucleoside-diphosphate-sugar epimerase [Ruminococcaceae bacterium KH2T8]